jgi:transcriptional regulator with XRE-family HTH domain
MDFVKLRWQAGFQRKSLSEYLDVSERTVRNWEINGAPVAVVKLMHLLNNDLSHLGGDWAGFYFYNGELMSPEGDYIRPGEIRASPYLKMSNQFRAEEITRLKSELESFRTQPGYQHQVKKLHSQSK